MWRIDSHGGATYTLFLHIRGATLRVQKIGVFFTDLWPTFGVLQICHN